MHGSLTLALDLDLTFAVAGAVARASVSSPGSSFAAGHRIANKEADAGHAIQTPIAGQARLVLHIVIKHRRAME